MRPVPGSSIPGFQSWGLSHLLCCPVVSFHLDAWSRGTWLAKPRSHACTRATGSWASAFLVSPLGMHGQDGRRVPEAGGEVPGSQKERQRPGSQQSPDWAQEGSRKASTPLSSSPRRARGRQEVNTGSGHLYGPSSSARAESGQVYRRHGLSLQPLSKVSRSSDLRRLCSCRGRDAPALAP